MKKWIWLALLPLAAFAATGEDYAWQWPLRLAQGDDGVHRVTLTDGIYRRSHRADLRDIDVVDARGRAVPAALFDADRPLDPIPPLRKLPWFPLPESGAGVSADIALIAERDSDGRVRRLTAQMAPPAMPGRDRAAAGWLVDASALEQPIRALELEWSPVEAPMEQRLQVEGSDDLREWRTLAADAPLLDLRRGGERLRQGRIEFPSRWRYLRLRPSATAATPVIIAVRAELSPPPGTPDWAWRALPGRRVVEQGREYFDFELDGRFPVERVDVAMPGNSTTEWTLHSREEADAPWLRRTGPWVAYRVSHAGGEEKSSPRSLGSVRRDRHWRLAASAPLGDGAAPVLRLGYRPEVLVFVAEGVPPYRLLAGSARAARAETPLPQTIAALRQKHGAGWQPAVATPGEGRQTSQGAAALQPPRDWKTWLLWALLLAGATLVAALAFSLLRKSARTDG